MFTANWFLNSEFISKNGESPRGSQLIIEVLIQFNWIFLRFPALANDDLQNTLFQDVVSKIHETPAKSETGKNKKQHTHLAKFQLTSISKGTIEPGKRIFDVLKECQNWKWSYNIYSYSANIVQWYASIWQPSFQGPNPSQPLCHPGSKKKSVPPKNMSGDEGCAVSSASPWPQLQLQGQVIPNDQCNGSASPTSVSVFVTPDDQKQKFRHVDEERWANKIEVRAKETI